MLDSPNIQLQQPYLLLIVLWFLKVVLEFLCCGGPIFSLILLTVCSLRVLFPPAGGSVGISLQVIFRSDNLMNKTWYLDVWVVSVGCFYLTMRDACLMLGNIFFTLLFLDQSNCLLSALLLVADLSAEFCIRVLQKKDKASWDWAGPSSIPA